MLNRGDITKLLGWFSAFSFSKVLSDVQVYAGVWAYLKSGERDL